MIATKAGVQAVLAELVLGVPVSRAEPEPEVRVGRAEAGEMAHHTLCDEAWVELLWGPDNEECHKGGGHCP